MKKFLLYFSFFLFSGALSAQVICDSSGGSAPCDDPVGVYVDICYYTTTCPAGFESTTGTLIFLCTNGVPDLLANNPPECIAPIELVYFRASLEDNDVVLEWETATETNNEEFEIFRSFDGAYFESIGNLDGAGTSVESKSYIFVDKNMSNNARSNQAFYYVKQIDFDGEHTMSDIVSVELEEVSTFELRNIVVNKNEGLVSVFFQTLNGGNVTATIYDINGKVLTTQDAQVEEGFASMDISVKTKVGGIYVVTLSNGKEIASKKFIK